MKAFFEVTFKVDTKRLGDALVSLDGKVYDVQHRIIKIDEVDPNVKLIPHITSPKKKGKVHQIKAFVEELKSKGIETFKTKDVVETVGLHPNYTSSILSNLQKEKLIKRVGTGVYKISR